MLDILAFGAHPDDCEIFIGGSLLHFKQIGLKVGVCDLTQGEMSTYGTVEKRIGERDKATKKLDLDYRHSLSLPDSQLLDIPDYRICVIEVIRQTRPKIVIGMQFNARHPDHSNSYYLVKNSCFLSGLEKLKMKYKPHRSSGFISYPEFLIDRKPSFIIDITPFKTLKEEVITCYSSQVLDRNNKEEHQSQPKTLIKSNQMWKQLEARSIMSGQMIGVDYGEPFYVDSPMQIINPIDNLVKKGLT